MKLIKKLVKITIAASIVPLAGYAQIVAIHSTNPVLNGFTNPSNINSFYNDLTGVTSSFLTEISDSSLAGVNLLWELQPENAYTLDELDAMSNFLAGGGRIAFMGEHGTYAPDENININSALSFLGATFSIQNLLIDSGFRTATRDNGQILEHPLTTGVDSYRYAAFAPIVLTGSNTQTLMLGTDLSTTMMAYENIGPGSIFLITDQNVWDSGVYNSSENDNARMFENLLLGNTGAPPVNPVPEPSTYGLIGFAIALGLVYYRRRISSRKTA